MAKITKTETVFLADLSEILGKISSFNKTRCKRAWIMKIMIFNIVLFTSCLTFSNACSFTCVEDSTSVKKRRSHLKLTTRLHSLGLFNYSGRLSSDNPAFDFNVTYDRPSWGVMLFNVMDLYDQHADNNFTMALLYKKIRLTDNLTITPHTGFSVERWGEEKGDRQIITTALKLNKKLTLDNSMLFANVFTDRSELDWVNRFRVLYVYNRHMDFTFSLWNNNKIFDTSAYLSYGGNASYGRIKITDHITFSTGITVLMMALTSDQENVPKKNGVVLTLGIVIN